MVRYLAYLLLGTLLILGVLFGMNKWVSSNATRSAYTADTTLHGYTIGIDELFAPRNHIRSPAQRGRSFGERLDLSYHWPSGLAYNSDLKDDFERLPSQLVNVTITPREMTAGMNDRLGSVYAEFFEGEPYSGPYNLSLQQLDSESAYGGEVLVIASEEVEPWAARCPINENTGAIQKSATCLHDFHAGENLGVVYRFNSDHLSDWREIDAMVRDNIASMLAN